MDTSRHKNKEIWVGVTITLLILVAASTWRVPNRLVPTALVGKWHTKATNYADRTFELDPVCISFTTGDGTISVGFIKEVEEVSEGGRMLYTVSYTVDEEPNQVSFYYDPNNGRTIWFKNQENVVWRKDHDS